MKWLDYYRTLLWAHRIRRLPLGGAKDRPYWRSIELALLGMARDYGVQFPSASEYTMLEFGVSSGESFALMLHFRDVLCRRLSVRQRVTCVGFDTFGGLPPQRADDVAAPWAEGDFAASIEDVRARLRGYDGFELVKGLFCDALPGWRARLDVAPPVFVSIDCDYYSSTMDVLAEVLPRAPTGCVFYFDDVATHYWSDRAGELQAVREVNEGKFGPHLQLAEYPLWIETGEIRHYKQIYRLVNLEQARFPTGA